MSQVSSAIPIVIAALIEIGAEALPGVTVTDGPATQDDYGDYLMVGVDDGDPARVANTARSSQQWAHATTSGRDENGSVTCCIYTWQPDTDMREVRERAFAYLDAMASAVLELQNRATCAIWRSGISELDFTQDQDQHGAVAVIIFRVDFAARLPGAGGRGGFRITTTNGGTNP